MYREAGVRTFFRGLVPTMIQVFPLAGFQFGFYALFKHVWEFFLPVHVDASVHETSKCQVALSTHQGGYVRITSRIIIIIIIKGNWMGELFLQFGFIEQR